MAILIPTVAPIASGIEGGYGPISIICLAAILDGAIFGDHCSPISDTSIMSSMSTSCDHIDHVKTQLPYSLFVASIALVAGYLGVAFFHSAWISIGLGVLFMAGFFMILSRFRAQ